MLESTFICQHHEPNDSPDAAPSILTTIPWEFFQATVFTINNVEYKTKTRHYKQNIC